MIIMCELFDEKGKHNKEVWTLTHRGTDKVMYRNKNINVCMS